MVLCTPSHLWQVDIQSLFYEKLVLYWNQYSNRYDLAVTLTDYFKNSVAYAVYRWTLVTLRTFIPCVSLTISNILLICALFVSRSSKQTLQEV